MAYRVVMEQAAKRNMAALPPDIQRRIDVRIFALADNPRPHGVKKLKGYRDYWRIRVGDFRIIYTIQDDRSLVTVLRIGNRRDVYG